MLYRAAGSPALVRGHRAGARHGGLAGGPVVAEQQRVWQKMLRNVAESRRVEARGLATSLPSNDARLGA
jgi:hypothetical protein